MAISIVILTFLLVLLMLPIFIDRGKEYSYQRAFQKTSIVAKLFGWLISVDGKIRVGKTSLTSGLTSIYEYEIMEKIENVFLETKKIFNRINFFDFDKQLFDYLTNDKNPNPNFDELTKKMMESYKIPEYFIYNFLIGKLSTEYIKDYIIAFYSFYLRMNFVQSKTRRLSPILHKMAMQFDPQDIEIFNKLKTKDYGLQPYSVIVHDEASDDRSAYNWREAIGSGSKEFKSKFGHIFKETSRMINIKQDSSDEILKERSLTQSHIQIIAPVKLGFERKFFYKNIKRLYKFQIMFYLIFKINIPYSIAKLKHRLKTFQKLDKQEFIDQFYDLPNKLRDYDRKVLFLKYHIDSLKYNIYHVKVYSNEEDIGKQDEKYYEEHVLVIPSKLCFTYPKFEYDKIQDDLINVSTKSVSEQEFFKKPDFFDNRKPKTTTTSEKDERMVTDVEF